MNKVHTTQAWQTWIEDILKERFGERFHMRLVGDRFRIMTLGSERSITVGPIDHRFYRPNPSADFLDALEKDLRILLSEHQSDCQENNTAWPLHATATNSGLEINFDIFGFIYWMLVRVEEVHSEATDRFGRFKSDASFLSKAGWTRRPVVDEILMLFGRLINICWPDLTPERKQCNVLPSHDIDRIKRIGPAHVSDYFALINGSRAVLLDVLKRKSRHNRFPSRRPGRKDRKIDNRPWEIEWLVNKSNEHNVASTFHFLCGRSSVLKDHSYSVSHPAVRDLIKWVYENNQNVGLHPSFNSCNDSIVLSREVEAFRTLLEDLSIKQGGVESRMHYLKWHHPLTLTLLDKAGVSVDTTLGYADEAGFRCGTCHEYPGFNPISGERTGIRIRPLVVMDVAVLKKPLLDYDEEKKILSHLLSLKEQCKFFGGNFTLLWHNTELYTQQRREIYEALIARC